MIGLFLKLLDQLAQFFSVSDDDLGEVAVIDGLENTFGLMEMDVFHQVTCSLGLCSLCGWKRRSG